MAKNVDACYKVTKSFRTVQSKLLARKRGKSIYLAVLTTPYRLAGLVNESLNPVIMQLE